MGKSWDGVMLDKENPRQGLLKKADLHIHSSESDGIEKPQKLVDIAIEKGIHAIAITDHDRFYPSEIAFNYAQQNSLPIEIVKGSEISTQAGHLLVYNKCGNVRSRQKLEDTIREVHRQNGLVVAAHPGLSFVSSISFINIMRIINSPDPEIYFDGIEVINGSGRRLQRLDMTNLFFNDTQEEIQNLFNPGAYDASKVGAVLAGSDTHTRRLGDVITLYNGDSILIAIKENKTYVSIEHEEIVTDILESIGMLYSILRSKTIGSMSRFKRNNAQNSNV